MPSSKIPVLEHIFDLLFDKNSGQLTRSIVTLNDVVQAIRHCNAAGITNLNEKNPANFLKDLIRSENVNQNWPIKLTQFRYTARQAPGNGQAFEFIPFEQGQTEPFPEKFAPSQSTPRHRIQTVSLPLASKALGRRDEAWLVQVAVNLRIVETHFATHSAIQVQELAHLQMSVKLRNSEIDALFHAKYQTTAGTINSAIVTCEAKQIRERLLEEQIINQVRAVFDATDPSLANVAIPIGMKVIDNGAIYLIEFSPVDRAGAGSLSSLTPASEAIYELVPPVPGI